MDCVEKKEKLRRIFKTQDDQVVSLLSLAIERHVLWTTKGDADSFESNEAPTIKEAVRFCLEGNLHLSWDHKLVLIATELGIEDEALRRQMGAILRDPEVFKALLAELSEMVPHSEPDRLFKPLGAMAVLFRPKPSEEFPGLS